MNQEELFHHARQIVTLETQFHESIKPKFPDTTFASWILSSNTVTTMEEFNTLYSMGKILTICDQYNIPKTKQPSNYQQHFQLLQRYVNNPQLLIAIWRNALTQVKSKQPIINH